MAKKEYNQIDTLFILISTAHWLSRDTKINIEIIIYSGKSQQKKEKSLIKSNLFDSRYMLNIKAI